MLKKKGLKSGNPKISRIGRQNRKNIFFLFSPEELLWLTLFGNDIKRFNFLFVYSKFAKPENSATGPSTAARKLEIWHMFNTLVRTHQTLS